MEEVFLKKEFTNSRGELVQVHSETSPQQCQFLQQIIRENGFRKSIEIGLAYGISTIAIMEEIVKNGGSHFVIDKFQQQDWAGNGLELVKQAGYDDKIEFREQYSYEVLPELLAKGQKFDFAYVDSTKQFDWILVDFFFLDKLLAINGVIVFDDVTWPGIRKVLRLVAQFPSYKVYGQHPQNYIIHKNKIINTTAQWFPGTKKIIREDKLLTDYELGVNAQCVAIQKISEDRRNWDWHQPF